MRSAYRTFPALLAMCLPMTAVAQTPPPCTAMVAPVGAFAPWATPTVSAAASNAALLANAAIPVGQALHLALLPQAEVKFPLPPGKPGAEGSHAGLLSLTITEAGTYRVALGAGAWVDVVDNGKAVASSEHDQGPACTGIHKIVDFTLHPGGYALQISSSPDPQMTVLVVRAP